jgi:hypothetical protein
MTKYFENPRKYFGEKKCLGFWKGATLDFSRFEGERETGMATDIRRIGTASGCQDYQYQ